MSSLAASSSTARDDSTPSRSDAMSSPSSKQTGTKRSTASSRTPRTLNTIPVWARKDEPSPPASRSNSLDRKRSVSKTLPRPPKPAFLQASTPANDKRGIEEHHPPSGDGAGPSRFWSFTMPAKKRGRSGGESSRRRNDSSDSSISEAQEAGRRSSFTNIFSSTIGDAFSTLAYGSTMGGNRTGRRDSQAPGEEEEKMEQGDAEPTEEQGWTHDSEDFKTQRNASTKRRQQLEQNISFSRHQPLTPGWESPWRPETRGGNSIEFGNYRYNHYGEGGYFPRSDTSQTLQKSRITNKNGMTIVTSREKTGSMFMSIDWWIRFLLENPFVPLLFRLINIAFTTSTLAIAIRLHILLRNQGAEAAVGSSPIVAVVFAPLTLVHVCFQIWLEYFSRPIGLWQVSSKLFYTLIDLIFVCLWSAELAISFDNYFTSTLVCTTFLSPYAGDLSSLPTGGQQSLNDPSVKPTICDLQRALIGLVFVSLLAYVVVLTVSLFRIFVRVTRR